MQLRGATASHVGNVRETNQDRAHFGGYVAAVADGMGGHQGGEMAASIAIKEFVSIEDPIGPGGLVELVEEANRSVFERASDPDLRGMGTTLVAVALRPNEEKVSVVNVGDSRAYFYREGELQQLTNDHSLVEDLVRQNRLTKEEALNHPQRNILTRALGIASQVEVDSFLVDVRIGDRFLLCSDGLFNEVEEVDIARMLQSNTRPDEAAEELVSAALASAGRDNVTVAVVDVVVDGEGANLSSRAAETLLVPSVATTTGEMDVTTEVAAAAAATQPAAAPPPAAAGVGVDVMETDGAPLAGTGHEVAGRGDTGGPREAGIDGEPDPRMSALELDRLDEGHNYDTNDYPAVEVHEPPRSRTGLLVAVVGVLALLAAITYFGVSVFANRTYFVGVDEARNVAVFQGRPGGFLWVDPTSLDEDTGLTADDLSQEDLARVEAEQTFDSQAEARSFVDQLRENQVADLDPDVTDSLQDGAESATSTSTSTTAPDDDPLTGGQDAPGSTGRERSEPGGGSSPGTTDDPSSPSTTGPDEEAGASLDDLGSSAVVAGRDSAGDSPGTETGAGD